MRSMAHFLSAPIFFFLLRWEEVDSFRPQQLGRAFDNPLYTFPSLSSRLRASRIPGGVNNPKVLCSNGDDADAEVLPANVLDYSSSAFANDEGTISRRMFAASGMLGVGFLLTPPALAATYTTTSEQQRAEFLWRKDPVNPKRSNFKVLDAENIYSVSFVTYLSRFLLSFDPSAQRWWIDRAEEIPKTASGDEIFRIREEQFARFSASVEVGLQEDGFVGKDGPRRLLKSLLEKFGTEPEDAEDDSNNGNNRGARETKEARRQIALLFGLLGGDSQPTKEITALLACIENGTVESVVLLCDDENDKKSARLLGGFAPGDVPTLEFPPPQAGTKYKRASGRATLKPTGRLLRIEVVDGGEGYASAPDISKILPKATSPEGEVATATAKVANGVLQSVKLTSAGSGYTEDRVAEVALEPPAGGGKPAKIRIVPDMAIASIDLDEVGSGYAVERPIKVTLVPSDGGTPQPIGVAYPKGQSGSFVAARPPGENTIRNFERALDDGKPVVRGTSSGGDLPPAPFPEKASSSQQLLALLPQGYGLEYDKARKLYVLSVDKEYQNKFPAVSLSAPGRPLVPDFGPRGRSPIERDQRIDLPTLLRFSISGAICASSVHLALTPLDVVKTKIQIDPERYPEILPSFRSVWKEEGPSTFFTGWLPTAGGYFVSGGVLYAATEVIRRSLTETAGASATALEVPIILVSASIASAAAAVLYCPFDAVRIRSVAQPGYGANAIAVTTRMVGEEGIGVLTDAIPVFVAKQVPYAAVKFTIFDLSTEYLYRLYPLAQEDLKLSLGVSLVCGVLAGIGAAAVSNPADAVISELKKAKSDQSPQEAFRALLDRGGVSALFKGLPIRMVLYSLTASFQFLIFDGVRFALGIGADDLRLYLDVLGEALNTKA